MNTDARGYVNARDAASTYRRMVEELEERDALRRTLDDAEHALSTWETEHADEYRELFALGEHGQLNALDAEWNTLEDERNAARAALEGWSL